MKITLTIVFLTSIIILGCAHNPERGSVQREGKAEIVRVEGSDHEINTAISKAQSTIDEFVQALESQKQGRSEFTIKYPFEENGMVEHMWVVDLKYDGRVFTGTLNNYPNDLTNFTYQQPVELLPDRISDWMYVEEGKLVGGFTIRALYKDHPEEKRRELEESLGAEVDW